MNKMAKLAIGLGSVLCLVLLGTGIYSRGYSDEFVAAPVGTVYVAPAGWNFEASWLIGHRVLTPLGSELGQIESLIIDKTNGRIALVVLSDVPNIGAKRLALPYSSITDIGQATCVFNPGNMVVGPSLEPNYVRNSDPYIYALTLGGHPELYEFPVTMETYAYPSTIDVVWLNDVYRTYGQVPYWEVEGQQEPSSFEFIDSSRLMGAQVQLASGEVTGEIHDFVVNAWDGKIVFVILSDVPDRPLTYVAVPFVALSTRENIYVINVTSDQLVRVRSYDMFSDLDNPRWASSVYLHFGLQPYWTERTEIITMPEMASPAPEELGNIDQESMDYGY